ncbi:glycosyltransferase [Clostridium sp. 1001275B_160808_H3]|uniref:glycosyltransferase n=1 Tax=Clostridium sp. 1001275B_160808_H3 TaxID=2787110 RepID=UPI001896AB34|nr:glycosyltransferase [Clostridium sp. 1001275B_160808_H3]
MRILYIGSLSKRRNRLDGVTIKSRVLEEWLKEKKYIDLNTVDVDSWRTNFLQIISKILINYRRSNGIIISSSSNGAYIFLKFLYYIKCKKPIYYFVAGGMLSTMIKKGEFDSKIYKKIRKIYIEPIDMVNEMKEMGFHNVEQQNNFRKVNYRPMLRNIDKTVKFVFFSRVIKEKGIEEAINAFADLKLRYENISFDIYGQVDSDYLEHLKGFFVEGVNYKGIIEPNNSDEYKVLSKYDVFILPTYHTGEGLPGALIDAYISGLAILVSEWKYAHQYVEDNVVGFIHRYKDYDSLCLKMELMIKNKDIINVFKKNSYDNAKKFLIEEVIKDFEMELLKESNLNEL